MRARADAIAVAIADTARSVAPLALAAALGLGTAAPASAVEPYAAVGFPYALVGVSQQLGDLFGVRADFGLLHYRYAGSTADDDYRGNLNYHRTALLGDWFVVGNGFRLTAGATFNQARASLRASARSGQITLGGITYNAPSSLYYLQSQASYPTTTPYLGLGWGHHRAEKPGITFNADLGASIGKARATPLTASPALASELALDPQGQADLASENRDFQDEVHKLKAIPQLTLGLGYLF